MNLSLISKSAAITVLAVALLAVTAGCDAPSPSTEVAAPDDAGAPVAAEPAAVVAPTPAPPATEVVPGQTVAEIAPPEPSQAHRYYYEPTNKPDPFVPYKVEQEVMSQSEVITRYEVRFFRLVGIVSSVRDPKAVFEDPQGNSYVLSMGDIIGKNGGVVTAILPEEVRITETRVTILGETRTNEIVMQLHPEDEQSI